MEEFNFIYREFDNLAEADKKDLRKIIYIDLILNALISLQYGALAGFAMAMCMMAKLTLKLSMFAGIIITASVMIFLWSFASKHMRVRRKALKDKIHVRLDLIKNRK